MYLFSVFGKEMNVNSYLCYTEIRSILPVILPVDVKDVVVEGEPNQEIKN